MRHLVTSCLALLALALPFHGALSAQDDPTARRFDDMKRLVGIWRNAETPGSPLRIRFSLTAGGTVLVEEWKRGDQPHSLTLYHRNGETVIATHYCPQGNQPRLRLHPQVTDNVLRFTFLDATDLDAADESHLSALTFDLSNESTIVRRERYDQSGKSETTELRLVREP